MKEKNQELEYLINVLGAIVEDNQPYESNYRLELDGKTYPLIISYDTEAKDYASNPNKLITPYLEISIKGRSDTVRSIIINKDIDHHDFTASMKTVRKAIYNPEFKTRLVDHFYKQEDIKRKQAESNVYTVESLQDKTVLRFWDGFFNSKKPQIQQLSNRVANSSNNTHEVIKNLTALCTGQSGNFNTERKVVVQEFMSFLVKGKLAKKEDLYEITEKGNIASKQLKKLFAEVNPTNLNSIQKCNLVDQFTNFLILNEFDKYDRIGRENNMNKQQAMAELVSIKPTETLEEETARLSKEMKKKGIRKIG